MLQEFPSPRSLQKRRTSWAFSAVILLATMLIIWWVAIFTEERSLDSLRKSGESGLSLTANSLRDTLERYRHIPYILARDPRIRALLLEGLSPLKVNPHLEDFALTAGVMIYVMNENGDTVVSSNWRTEQSLIGENYAFRPYFQDAKEGKAGSYYTVGFKTRKPGFFISYPVLDAGGFAVW